MPMFEGKDGKKAFHMNPQQGKSMYSGSKEKSKPEEHGSEHSGHSAHHVEVYHGGHPAGEPPMDETHTHHTITHHSDGSEPSIHNHASLEEAKGQVQQDMGDGSEESSDGSMDSQFA